MCWLCHKALPDAFLRPLHDQVKRVANLLGTSDKTTNNDKIRILELRAWAGAACAWTRALGPKTRLELDRDRSSESEETIVDP